MEADTYKVSRDGAGAVVGGIDLVESPDDGGWYAQEYNFTRKDSATRTSRRIYSTRIALIRALDSSKHHWQKWS